MNAPSSSEEMAERVGKLADKCDNLLSAMRLPLPEHIHRQALKESLTGIRQDLREIYTAMTGDDPWNS